ncbi:MAG: PDZ domain-containing protein [Bryobacteraceae bacterium]
MKLGFINLAVVLTLGALGLAGHAEAQSSEDRAKSRAEADKRRADAAEARAEAKVRTLRPRTSSSFLGVGVAEIDRERAKALNLKEERGVEVKKVDAESPAAMAGLQENDVVLEYNGQRVEGSEQFIRLVRETPAGRQSKLLISRGGSTQTVTATIGERSGPAMFGGEGMPFIMPRIPEFRMPDMPRTMMSWQSATLGVESESLGSQLAEFFGVKDGVLVRSVVKGSAAEKAGIKAGDVITKVDDQKAASPKDISKTLQSLKDKKTFPVTLVRNKKEKTVSVTIEDKRSSGGSRQLVRRDRLEL